ncbi:MAG: phosphonate ABC transporter, permease protein PhnE [Firmicutes bacterium]|nr:phosphonate ABC transporter, permease protein PhnE [Bacillota bacterium]
MKKNRILENPTVESALKSQPKTYWFYILIGLFLLYLIIASFEGSGINSYRLAQFAKSFGYMLKGFLNPDWDYFFGRGEIWEFADSIVLAAIVTIAIAFIGTALSLILAIPMGFISARNITGKATSKVGDVTLVFIRTFPEIVLALVLLRVFGYNALTGVITIAIHSVGMLGKLFAESIENIDKGVLEALDAVGANWLQKIRYGVLPQVLPDFISISLYRFDINLRSSTVLGYILSIGLGLKLAFASNGPDWNKVASVMIAIVVLISIIDFISGKIRTKLV